MKGFEYAKQRCTAYPRYAVQRELFPAFVEMYLPVVRGLRFGHPLAVEAADDDLPELQFGPVISAGKAAELQEHYRFPVSSGGIPLYEGRLAQGRFLDGQDTSAYVAPAWVLEPPPSWALRHAEPFGPLDSCRDQLDLSSMPMVVVPTVLDDRTWRRGSSALAPLVSGRCRRRRGR